MEFNRLDVSAKELIWDDPAACLDRFGIGPPGPVEVIDSDITVLTASADKVLKVGGDQPYLVDLEPHSYHDSGLERTLWFRQVALDYRHDLPVLTILVLLCKEANSPSLDGQLRASATRRLADESVQLPGGSTLGGRPRVVPDRRCQPGAAGAADQSP